MGVRARFFDIPPGRGDTFGYSSYPWEAYDGRTREVFKTFAQAVEWLSGRCASPWYQEPEYEDVWVGGTEEPPAA